MSLAFLAKKSWHTANLRNVEKVWIAEQKHAAEEKKVEELRKNIEEERQLQELRQLQASQGNKAAAQERLDWMYEGPSAAREKSTEEYLLGKEYKEEDAGGAATADLSTTSKYGSLALSKTALPANDAFSRLNEDPMMVIRMRQKAARESVLKNPVKMNKIKAQVDKLRDDKKARKKARKEAKKERKHARREEKRRLKKKRKRGDSSDDSAPSETEELKEKASSPACASYDERRRSRSRDRSHPRHGRSDVARRDRSPVNRREASRDGRRRSRSASRGRSRSSSRRCERHRRHHQARSRSGERKRGTFVSETKRHASCPAHSPAGRRSKTPPRRDSRSDHVDRHRGRRSRSPEGRRRRDRDRDREHRQMRGDMPMHQDREKRRSSSRDRHRTKRTVDDNRDGEQDRRHEKASESGRRKPLDTEGKYGLISTAGAVESKEVDKTSLGPNAKFLAKAREVKRQEEEERRRKLSKSSHGEAGRPLTAEEKKRLAAQMVEDAKQRDEYITKRAARKKDELDEREQQATSDNPEFLREMRSTAYLSGENSMGDRIRRNKHYIQKNADASNFLSK